MAEVAAEVQRSRSCSFIPSLPRANHHHHLLSLSSSHHLTTVAPTPFQPLSSPYVPSTKNMRYQVESTMCVVAPSRQLARQLAHTLPQPPRRAEGRREWTLDEIDAEWNETTKQSESWARQVADIPLCTIYPRAEIETFIIQIGLALQAKYATNDHQQRTTYSMRVCIDVVWTSIGDRYPVVCLRICSSIISIASPRPRASSVACSSVRSEPSTTLRAPSTYRIRAQRSTTTTTTTVEEEDEDDDDSNSNNYHDRTLD